MHAHTRTENPLETRVENTAYCIIQSVEYSVKVYTTDRRDSACEPIRRQLMDTQRPTTERSRSMASGLKDMGRFPIFCACEEASDGAYAPEATIGRSWPLGTTTWAGYTILYTMLSKFDRPYFPAEATIERS
jgi:hypothetical protein